MLAKHEYLESEQNREVLATISNDRGVANDGQFRLDVVLDQNWSDVLSAGRDDQLLFGECRLQLVE